ncbi:MAG: hypothetical protein HYV33_03840 [Candidatus Kerfeldbacteria bacterium]|nr:hypothetical protein [Candidatus Kerfeldbacteria bacterium]
MYNKTILILGQMKLQQKFYAARPGSAFYVAEKISKSLSYFINSIIRLGLSNAR